MTDQTFHRTTQYLRTCFTFFQDPFDLSVLDALKARASYLCVGPEICPDTGRKHLQGYAEFPTKILGSVLSRLLPRCNYIKARGSAEDNRNYCNGMCPKKNMTLNPLFEDWGIYRPGQGTRTDLNASSAFVRAIRTDYKGPEDLWDRFPKQMLGHRSMVERILQDCGPKMKEHPVVRVLTGPTGVGKTYQAFVDGAEFLTFDKGALQGYTASNPVVCFDEFDYSQCTITQMLKMIDKYPCPVNIKNGTSNWGPRVIYLTSNITWTEWWPKASDAQKAAFARKVEDSGGEITTLTNPYVQGTEQPTLFSLWNRDGVQSPSRTTLVASMRSRARSRTPPSRGSSTTPSPRNLSPVAAASRLRRGGSAFQAPEQTNARRSTRRPLGALRLPTPSPVGNTPLPMQYITDIIPSQDTADTDVPCCVKCTLHIDECACLGV